MGISRWRIDRTVARLAVAGLANVLALLFVAGWMVGAHMLSPPARRTAAPFVAGPRKDVETTPVEEPLPLQRDETAQPERSAPAPPPVSRWASTWKAPSWTTPVRPASYGDLIRDAALDRALSPSLVEAMARVESGFNPSAVSRKGARGLLQVLPATARRFGFEPDRLFEAEHNLAAGTAYMAWLLGRYGGDLDLALAAYNAGEGAVDDHGGIPPYSETQQYVRRVKEALGGTESSVRKPELFSEFPYRSFEETRGEGEEPFGSAESLLEGDLEQGEAPLARQAIDAAAPPVEDEHSPDVFPHRDVDEGGICHIHRQIAGVPALLTATQGNFR